MVTLSHLSDDPSELLEVRSFRRQKRDAFEERDDALKKRLSLANYEHQRHVALAIRLDVATAETIANEFQHLSPVAVLADMELRDELETNATRSIALHRNREASFSVYVTRDVAVQPFLLIVRTRHVFTTVNVWSDVTMSSAGFSEFPAYGRIYRQQGFTVSRRSEPSSRTALTGEQPDPWDLLQPQDATSRHRGAKPFRRCGLLGRISLLSPEYLLSVERRQFHASPPDHYGLLSHLLDLSVSQSSSLMPLRSTHDFQPC
jgi:hypothetical protein